MLVSNEELEEVISKAVHAEKCIKTAEEMIAKLRVNTAQLPIEMQVYAQQQLIRIEEQHRLDLEIVATYKKFVAEAMRDKEVAHA